MTDKDIEERIEGIVSFTNTGFWLELQKRLARNYVIISEKPSCNLISQIVLEATDQLSEQIKDLVREREKAVKANLLQLADDYYELTSEEWGNTKENMVYDFPFLAEFNECKVSDNPTAQDQKTDKWAVGSLKAGEGQPYKS